ncbi:MAG: transketolase [Chloroflexi bacterium 13_1_20CM_4_66_7]|nr:MAG: transketolase [Chloroflexi bacterium 13_1_20CM_4_66_7]
MISRANAAHVGTVFSCAELLACLYGRILRVRPAQPAWPDRDRFVMSKGHGSAGLYAALALRGFFPLGRLDEFSVDGGSLYGHVTHRGVPGVDVSTGALGHGLALAVGFAAGAMRQAVPWRVFALLSDGECDEGSTWEAALLAPAWKQSNLTAIIDYNKIQSLGRVEDILPLEPFAEKWKAFGWDTREVDGHDIPALLEALDPERWVPTHRPRCVIAHTVKGKGVSFMEDALLWHYRTPKGEEYERALAELERSA